MKMIIYNEKNEVTSTSTDKDYIKQMLLYYFINNDMYNTYICKVIENKITFKDKINKYKIIFSGVSINDILY